MAVLSSTQTIRDQIAERLNEVEADNSDRYNNYVNLGIYDFYNSAPEVPNLQTSADRTVSSGTRLYTHLPSDFDKMNTVTDPAGDTMLKWLHPEQFDLLQPSATESGRPTIYTIRGVGASGRIEYYPTPGGSYTFHFDYQKVVPTVSTGSSTPEIPARYYEALVDYGEALGLRKKGRYDDARDATERYEALKQQFIMDMKRRVTENDTIKSIRDFQQAGASTNDPIANLFKRDA